MSYVGHWGSTFKRQNHHEGHCAPHVQNGGETAEAR